MRSGGQKKQDFCKNAQWRAKKLRERGSSTARPTEKGGGGLQIGARRVGFGASFRADSVGFGASFRADSVGFGASIWSAACVAIRSRFGRVDLECCLCRDSVAIRSRFGRASCRFRRASCRDLACWLCRSRRVASKHKTQTQKKPDSSIGESGSAIARRRALLTFR